MNYVFYSDYLDMTPSMFFSKSINTSFLPTVKMIRMLYRQTSLREFKEFKKIIKVFENIDREDLTLKDDKSNEQILLTKFLYKNATFIRQK